ncbi:MAG TPA: AMP-binding protein [Candidatus Pacearchaeota archaeon]|nr:AMP-binding protein [Candidatus Pacearchaeota archaeon]
MAKADYYVPDDRPWFKYYPKDVPHHLDYPEIPLYQFLDDSAQKYPNNTALVFYGNEIKYKKLKELTDRFANALQNLGIQKGDRVLILLPNCPQTVIALYGTMKAGAIPVPLNPMYTDKELEYFFKDLEPRIVITLDGFYDKVEKASKTTPQIEKIITTNISDYFPLSKRVLGRLFGKIQTINCPNAVSFNGFIKNSKPQYNEIKINPKEDIAVILYTGGTTGEPKGVMLTHFNIVSNVTAIDNWFKDTKIESSLIVVPLFHSFGITPTLSWSVLKSRKIFLLPKFHPKECAKLIKENKIQFFAGVPAMFAALWENFKKEEIVLDSLILCGSAGASLSSYLWQSIQKMAPNTIVVDPWGLSEASPMATMTPLSPIFKREINSIGVPVFDTDVKVVDSETKEELPVNESGELIIKGPQVFKGYWKKEEKTKQTLKDGWIYTKDIGRMNKDGLFYYEGRLDDMINVRGEKVWPREIEEILESNPKIQEVAVVGVKDDYYGQAIKACVVLKEGMEASEKEIIDFCKDKLAPHKIPHMVEFFNELPKSIVGKILHYRLREKIK